MKTFFKEDACIKWHNTNESFTLDEFIKINCEYPDDWYGEIERIEKIEELTITALKIYNKNKTLFFHVVSFIRIKNNKIVSIDEYWGNDNEIPKWRRDMKIGKKIK